MAISQFLKGKIGDGRQGCQLLFSAPVAAAGDLEQAQAGKPANPQIATGDIALMFLAQVKGRPGKYRVVLGALGYVKLDPATPDASRQRLQQLQEAARKVEDAALRKQLEDVYRQALEFLDRAPGPKSAL